MKKVYFKTFGCRTNIYDTQIMMQSLSDYSITQKESEADIIVVNSCTVTNGADSGVRSYINAVNRMGKKVLLAGCGAFSKGEELFEQKKVFGVLGHSEKEKLNSLLSKEDPFVQMGDLKSIDQNIVSEYVGKSKAFLKIQEGCNFRCAYCIIPYVRGDARSQDEERIIEQVQKLAINGFGEFVLTGTNIGSYGRDKGSNLGTLLQRLSQIRGVRRIRLGSIEPIQIDESFREVLQEPWLERHLHIALQHTSDSMLKLMRRRNDVQRDLVLFEELSELGYALGTDFITGHPGESDAIWSEALDMFKKFPLTHLHAFCYSKRDGTPSAKMQEQVRGDVAKARLKELELIIADNNFKFRKSIQSSLEVLVEEKKGEFYSGFDQYYNRVYIQSQRDLLKEWVSLESFSAKEDGNYAKY